MTMNIYDVYTHMPTWPYSMFNWFAFQWKVFLFVLLFTSFMARLFFIDRPKGNMAASTSLVVLFINLGINKIT